MYFSLLQSFQLGPIDNGIIHSGVPTQTTSTLTPTTLRNIEQVSGLKILLLKTYKFIKERGIRICSLEVNWLINVFHVFSTQTFYDLTNESPSSVPCQAGFVPPLPSFPYESEQHHDPENSLGSSGGGSSTGSSCPTPPPNLYDDSQAGSNSSKLLVSILIKRQHKLIIRFLCFA